MEGSEEIRKGFALRQAKVGRMSRHVCNNQLIDVIDEKRAEGTVYLTLYRHDGDPERRISPLDGPVMVGEYRDRFVRTERGWRFSERITRVSFAREAGASGGPRRNADAPRGDSTASRVSRAPPNRFLAR